MGKPFNQITPLGKVMAREGWRLRDLAAVSGVCERTISDYLAGRKTISMYHAWPISEALEVDVNEITSAPSRVSA